MNLIPPEYNNLFITPLSAFREMKYSNNVIMKCCRCNKQFETKKKYIHETIQNKRQICCSVNCGSQLRDTRIEIPCNNCGKIIKKQIRMTKKFKFSYCSQSCAAIYHNKHKTGGGLRSRMEKYIEQRLKNDYPYLNILLNDRLTVGIELDFFIPSMKLAFEINGIFHYEPIFSTESFEKIQNRDKQKMIRCYEQNIELCVIDISKFGYYKESKAEPYYNIIKNIIDLNINRLNFREQCT